MQCQEEDDSIGDSDATNAYDLGEFDDLLPPPPPGLTAEEFDQFIDMDATTQCHGMPTGYVPQSSWQVGQITNMAAKWKEGIVTQTRTMHRLLHLLRLMQLARSKLYTCGWKALTVQTTHIYIAFYKH